MMMNKTASLLPALLVALCFWVASAAQAQVAVYRLSFEQTGDSINYRPYQSGYYIAPIQGGEGTLILTLVTGNTKQYFSYEGFGEMFVALKGENQRMVISATATNDVSTTVFYALGKTEKELNVESRNAKSKIKVAEKMTGYAVSADSEKDLPFSGSGTSVGVAGVSILTARLDENMTTVAIRDNKDTAAQLETIVDTLEAGGYVDGNPPATGGNGAANAATGN
ncbi:MAG TPA: hypothetical protein VK968_00060 [Roseimicrobium sp.]|nr:hypothetical protein [Roseimicrobium sp.]